MGLCFAHPVVRTQHLMWENYLGFGAGFLPAEQLQSGWHHQQVPGNRSWPLQHVIADVREMQHQFVAAADGVPAVYHLGQHQDTFDHCPSAPLLRRNYLASRTQKPTAPLWSDDCWSVVFHIRRGDVNKAHKIGAGARVQSTEYFVAAAQTLRMLLTPDVLNGRPVCYHVVSQGNGMKLYIQNGADARVRRMCAYATAYVCAHARAYTARIDTNGGKEGRPTNACNSARVPGSFMCLPDCPSASARNTARRRRMPCDVVPAQAFALFCRAAAAEFDRRISIRDSAHEHRGAPHVPLVCGCRRVSGQPQPLLPLARDAQRRHQADVLAVPLRLLRRHVGTAQRGRDI